ncbi:hypothetical protein [Streptomyces sp. NBC_00343]|uniref:hypothetical protein n=1 Tax=Streptomyces sp. NBC_00343 TaxID=2975719 RepID=UPI002E2A0079|nr:hypothetical protein [Streptomyces sp. NBC_00343]
MDAMSHFTTGMAVLGGVVVLGVRYVLNQIPDLSNKAVKAIRSLRRVREEWRKGRDGR